MDFNYPPVGFYFLLKIEGEEFGFKEVSGISSEINTEEIMEGGENRFKYKVPTSVKYNNLVLKRGFIPNNSLLITWINNTLQQDLAGTPQIKNLEIFLLNENDNKVMHWNFVGAWPIGIESANLNSLQGEVLIESLDFSYNYFTTKIINP